MRLSLTDRERTLREEVRAFLDDHPVDPDDVPADFDARVTFLRGWQRQLSEAGLVGITWPAAYGGRGATQIEKIIVGQEMSRAGAPELIGSVGLEVIGPSLIEHGTDAQKARYVAPILSAAELWCQGFSEPGAGSDLAALRTRAEDRGDHFLLRGQKIWTTNAQHARWCAVLAVTDAEVPAHKGISYLIVDLESPGIEVRALALSTGDAEFGEVFFDDVRVPKENLLGPLNGGWRIAMHTLAHERGPYAMGRQVLLSVQLDRLIELAREIPRDGGTAWEVPEIRASLARARIALEVLKHQCYSSVGRSLATGHPGFETSIDKILLGTAEQRLAQTALDVLGPYATTSDSLPWGDNLVWHHAYLYGRAGSVYGGTAQVQKNIIAERILGLPQERVMDLELNDDQAELRRVARDVLDREAPIALARAYLDGERGAPGLWRTLASLGWYAVGLEDDDPLGIPGLCLLAEQCGAHVAPTALIDTAVVARAFSAAPDPRPERLIAALLRGDAPVALAALEESAGWTAAGQAATAVLAANGEIVLDGVKLAVHHGADVPLLAVLADHGGEPALCLVPAGAEGVSITSCGGLDPGTAPVRVACRGVRLPAERCVAGAELVENALRVGAVATAAEGLGAARAVLELAVAYAKDRRQFGRPIGAFQAVQHLLADAYVARESGWASVLYAAGALDQGLPEAAEAVAIAKANGGRAAREVAEAALQVLGGVGFTWEHDAHLFQRRALECERRYGDTLQHERTVAGYLAAPQKATR